MNRNGLWRRLAIRVLVCGSVAGCGVMRQMGMAPTPAPAPPRSWKSAVRFVFEDRRRDAHLRPSTQVEFASGGRRWRVTERDLFVTGVGETRTPWYPLRPREQPVELYFTIVHPNGARTLAQFPLPANRGFFYYVSARVYTKRPLPGFPPIGSGHETPFPLHLQAEAEPGDSLWIGLAIRDGCFDCPS